MVEDDAHADPWHVPPPASDAPRRAAIATWTVAAVQLLAFGCCSCMLTAVGLMPEGQFRQQLERPDQEVSPEQVDMLVQIQPFLLGLGVVLMAAIVLPALVLVILAFKVRAASLGATTAARLILILQAVLVSLLVLANVVSAILQGDILGMLMPLVIFGGLLILMVWAIRRLGEVRDAIDLSRAYHDQPWNV